MLRGGVGARYTWGPSIQGICGEFGLEDFVDKRLAVFSDERFTGRLDVGAAGSRLLKLTAFDFQSVHRKEYDRHHPDAIVGSSRGGAVAMNLDSGSTPLVLLCPAWRRWGTATTVKPGTVILHKRGRRRGAVCRQPGTGAGQRHARVGPDRREHRSPARRPRAASDDAASV